MVFHKRDQTVTMRVGKRNHAFVVRRQTGYNNPMLNEFFAWYMAPWRRIGRAPFNTVVALASVPSMLLGVMGMAQGAGGMLGPLGDMMNAGQSLQNAVDGAPPTDVHALEQALNHMQNAGTGMQQAPGFSFNTGWLDTAIWLALIPLVHMRLRDVGVKPKNVWVWTALLYAGMLMSLVDDVAGQDIFGWWATLAGLVNLVGLGWLCLAPSKARGVTDGPSSATGNLDDHDPYPPFRP